MEEGKSSKSSPLSVSMLFATETMLVFFPYKLFVVTGCGCDVGCCCCGCCCLTGDDCGDCELLMDEDDVSPFMVLVDDVGEVGLGLDAAAADTVCDDDDEAATATSVEFFLDWFGRLARSSSISELFRIFAFKYLLFGLKISVYVLL